MPQNSITKRYRRARRNYLSRRRTVQSEGYIVPSIEIPKRITEGSIRRLEKQTTDYMRLKSRKIETVYEPPAPREQETRRSVTYTPTAERQRQQQTPPPEPDTDIPDAAKIALERFRETINDVTPRVVSIMRNFLSENADNLDDVAIALMNNPEYQPSPQDSERAVAYKLYLLQNIVDAGTMQQLEDAGDVVYEEEE